MTDKISHLNSISSFRQNLWSDIGWSPADSEQRLPHHYSKTEIGKLKRLETKLYN